MALRATAAHGLDKRTTSPHHRKAGIIALIAGLAVMTPTVAQTLEQPAQTALEEKAAYYIEYRNDLSVVAATPINSAAVVRDAHQRLASHDPEELMAGWMAYAALVAADTPGFRDSLVEAFEEDKKSRRKKRRKKNTEPELTKREAFIQRLRANPQTIAEITGGNDARNAVLDMAARDAVKMQAIGQTWIGEAYSMQNKSWAKKKIKQNGTQRVASAASYATTRGRRAAPVLPMATSGGVNSPQLASVDAAWSPGWGPNGTLVNQPKRADAVLNKVLVLAARYAVGEITPGIVDGYAKTANGSRCMKTAQLNFNQCMAATRTPYEEAFCIGQHGLQEPSGCIGWVAGAGGKTSG